jgi:hypothetical protein
MQEEEKGSGYSQEQIQKNTKIVEAWEEKQKAEEAKRDNK